MIVVLGFSHVDHWLAVRWMRWVSRLCMEEGGDSSGMTLVLFGTRRITPAQWMELRAMHYHTDCMFNIVEATPSDEKETGYPGSATHLFFRAAEFCEKNFSGEPFLWCEADTCAMRPGWAQEIASEYRAVNRSFMGVQSSEGAKHMPGVAVYPPNWRSLSPCLSNAIELPDISQWGRGKGQAWDAACGHEIVPKMGLSKTIYQIWKPRRITEQTLARIPQSAALFHQCKDGSMADILAARMGVWW